MKITPNKVFLGNAILQTEGIEINPTDWPGLLYERLSQLNFTLVQKDVQSFLKQPDDAQLITQENFNRILNLNNQ
ncbi:MAG: hypothetical protein IIB44_09080 [Candidatus Marinimicrobia bacterium]|nr:hypothetical protein [Candidatus Neomarinimicrobiota bacterium]